MMYESIDSRVINFLKGLAVTIAIASVFAAANAHAELTGSETDEYFELSQFDAEVRKCVELLRPTIGVTFEEHAVYEVTDVAQRGNWYNFTISTSVFASDGSLRLKGFNVGCKSNARLEIARLSERKNDLLVDRKLVVKNTKDLLLFRAVASNSSPVMR